MAKWIFFSKLAFHMTKNLSGHLFDWFFHQISLWSGKFSAGKCGKPSRNESASKAKFNSAKWRRSWQCPCQPVPGPSHGDVGCSPGASKRGIAMPWHAMARGGEAPEMVSMGKCGFHTYHLEGRVMATFFAGMHACTSLKTLRMLVHVLGSIVFFGVP